MKERKEEHLRSNNQATEEFLHMDTGALYPEQFVHEGGSEPEGKPEREGEEENRSGEGD